MSYSEYSVECIAGIKLLTKADLPQLELINLATFMDM